LPWCVCTVLKFLEVNLIEQGILGNVIWMNEAIYVYLCNGNVSHFLDHPEVHPYNVLEAVQIWLNEQNYIETNEKIGFHVNLNEGGLCYVVPAPYVGTNELTTFAIRSGRHVPSRVVFNVEPIYTNTIRVVLFKDARGFKLITAFWCVLEDIEIPRGLSFWQTRAFVYQDRYQAFFYSTFENLRNEYSYSEFN
jgi:hypothetical protein